MSIATGASSSAEEPQKDVSVPFPKEPEDRKEFVNMVKQAYGFEALKHQGYQPPRAPTEQETEEMVRLRYEIPELEFKLRSLEEAIESIRADQAKFHPYVGSGPVENEALKSSVNGEGRA